MARWACRSSSPPCLTSEKVVAAKSHKSHKWEGGTCQVNKVELADSRSSALLDWNCDNGQRQCRRLPLSWGAARAATSCFLIYFKNSWTTFVVWAPKDVNLSVKFYIHTTTSIYLGFIQIIDWRKCKRGDLNKLYIWRYIPGCLNTVKILYSQCNPFPSSPLVVLVLVLVYHQN